MKSSLRLALAAAALAIATPALATNGMRMIGFGPIQDAMGGASVGAPLDASVQVTNPAGITWLGNRIDFGALYFDPSVKVENFQTEAGPMAFESKRPATPIPSAGLVAHYTDWSIGIGMYGVGGMGVDYQGAMGYTAYQQMRFTPSVAYKLSDKLSLGLTVNAMYAQMEWDTPMGARPSSSSLGWGAVLGVFYRPMDWLDIGLAYETKSVFPDFTWQAMDPDTGAFVTDKLEFNQPQAATLGLGLKPMKGLLVAADVQWINWKQTNGQGQPEWKENASGQPSFNMNWDDQVVLKLGAQYDLKPVVLRVGYNYGKMPVNKSSGPECYLFPAIAEQHYTAGASFTVSPHVDLNLSLMYSPESKLDVPPTMNGDVPVFPPFTVKMSQKEIGLGISFRM